MQELRELEAHVLLLLQQHKALRAENRKLKKRLAASDENLAKAAQQLEEAKQLALAGSVAALLPGAKEKQKVRKQLDAVINDIDKILTSLND